MLFGLLAVMLDVLSGIDAVRLRHLASGDCREMSLEPNGVLLAEEEISTQKPNRARSRSHAFISAGLIAES